ncbi:hypothetical protein LSCM1_07313 [Leishmania martiniquensis]|uniref:PH domain-containing protein n=1 Tax=Leishmania martiniquensis TaxID=1580590 RepID=A0A836I183_9TRYP|nr:hypothetical protein LSCM1_07313 [Leishmania martiniquensis]
MSIAADPSVSDSIAYLQDFVKQSGSSTRNALPQESPDTFRPGLRDSPLAERRSLPNISILSHRSSSAPPLDARGSLRRDSGGEDGHASIGTGATYAATGPLGSGKTFVYSANDWRRAGVLKGTSPLQGSWAAAASTSADYSPHIRNTASASDGRAHLSRLPSSLSDSTVSRSAASAASAAPSSRTMFRYGKDSAGPPSSFRSYSYFCRGAAGGGGGWAASSPPPASGWERRRASSLSPPQLYRRANSAAVTPSAPLGWRHASTPPPPISGRGSSLSSLLWGWRDHSGGGAYRGIATGASPSPHSPPRHRRTLPWEEDSAQGLCANRAPASYAPPAARAPRRDAAYEEVKEEPSSQWSGPPLRRPPLAPSATGATSTATPLAVSDGRVVHSVQPVELASGHSADEHAANIHRIARYLKDYYAREAGEKERGVESLSAEDVAGLVQCFYVDLYRTVRQARQAAGLETSSFQVEDPTENVIESIAPAPPPPPPPRPLQRERADTDAQEQGPTAFCRSASAPHPCKPSAAPDSGGRAEKADGHALCDAGVQAPLATTLTSRPPAATACATRQPSDNATLPSQPFVSAWAEDQQRRATAFGAHHALANGSATSDVGPTCRAPNSQLAFSGGGTHPVQIITARLPAFRNDDTATMGDGHPPPGDRRPSAKSPALRTAAGTPPGSRVRREAGARGSSTNRAAAECGALPHRLEKVNSDTASSLALAAMPSPPYRHPRRVVDAAEAAPSRTMVQHHKLPPSQQQMIFGTPHRPPLSAPNGFAAALSPWARHRQVDTNNRGQRRLHERQGAPLRAGGGRMRMRDGYVDSSSDSRSSSGGGSVSHERSRDDGETRGRGGCKDPGSAAGRATLMATQEPTSGIVKRPLKDLMPLLRSRGTLVLKHIHNSRRPHLRRFQILDCVATYNGSEVLMPHLTWATPAEVCGHDRSPRAKRSKHGVPLPTGLSFSQQEVPYETALNLHQLEAVYVGVGRGITEAYVTLFYRTRDSTSSRSSRGSGGGGSAAVRDHVGRPVANGMCAVFVFASRPVAVSFLCEDDRQLWVGALMGVVERNRTLRTWQAGNFTAEKKAVTHSRAGWAAAPH